MNIIRKFNAVINVVEVDNFAQSFDVNNYPSGNGWYIVTSKAGDMTPQVSVKVDGLLLSCGCDSRLLQMGIDADNAKPVEDSKSSDSVDMNKDFILKIMAVALKPDLVKDVVEGKQ